MSGLFVCLPLQIVNSMRTGILFDLFMALVPKIVPTAQTFLGKWSRVEFNQDLYLTQRK